jgi:hypothetical protein
VLTQSALLTAHLIGLRGVPILRRSVIYRTLLAESIADPSAATCGRARRARLAVLYRAWLPAERDADTRLFRFRSAPGRALHGSRKQPLGASIAGAGLHACARERVLEVCGRATEVADYRLEFKKLGWVIEGRKADSRIGIHIPQNRPATIRPNAYSIARQVGETLLRGPLRPGNFDVKYKSPEYWSDNPLNLGHDSAAGR